ncbi:MAG: UvrD-helicase domain-containing protein, partial [Lachnospiraceae bacterium]|nr:UvrD-helicase domain-containing protein [Lachnospiraceae bacterium]
CYSTGTSEKKIEDAILRLYHFSMSYPFPEQWLTERLEDYKIGDVSELPDKKWFQSALTYIRTILQECKDRLHQALEIAGSVGGPIQYSENLTSDIELIEKFQRASDYNELHDLFTYSAFTRLSAKRAEGVDPVLKDMVKAIRDEVKKNTADLKKFLFQISVEDTLEDMAACQESVEELVSLTLSFKKMLDQSKRDKNVIDFSDMEHFALQILLKKDESGNIIPGNTALELQDHFEEIMIDEYQDSNEVQELLLKCISGEDKGRFNRFMVGDVKQSIYKFRLARPEIFMEKYNTYVIENDAAKNVRIDLSMNFRSRREVTDSTNFICSQLMTAKVGNVEYDDRAALYVGASYPEPEDKDGANIYQTELLIATPESLLTQDDEDNNAPNTEKQKYT